jgi:hypothetical protein
MANPTLRKALRVQAERLGVCVRPVPIREDDTVTGGISVVPAECGARLSSQCKPCAEKNRRRRVQQISEGWHLTEEPQADPNPPSGDQLALVRLRASLELARDGALRASQWDQVAEVDEAITELQTEITASGLRGHLSTSRDRAGGERSTRSTRRRQDAPDLPRLKVQDKTLGRVYRGRDGKAHQPSTLITLTLDSYGPVHTAARRNQYARRPKVCPCGQVHGSHDPLLGVPIDMDSYDYRRAALDAIHFAKVQDRWWQNLRRASGLNLQYAGCVELQKRLAPHTHFAMRGTLPRKLLQQVAAATYTQVWWPHFDTPAYTPDTAPTWDVDQGCYTYPDTDGEPLITWEQAIAALDPESGPAYTVRLGSIDSRGIAAGTGDAKRSVRYITKYVTKDITEQANPRSDAQKEHFDRLHAQLVWLPCSPTCANWLLYGVQPDHAKPGLTPGRCRGKVHQRHTLGFTGRRMLVSRKWSTRTLADVKADNRAWVKAILSGALDGHEQDAADDQAAADGRPVPAVDPMNGPKRYRYSYARPGSPGVPTTDELIAHQIEMKLKWKADLDAARARAPDRTATPTNDVHNGQ